MFIKDITLKVIKVPLIKPFVTSLRRVDVLESIVLRIETENGMIGYGETAPTLAVTGERKESIIGAVDMIQRDIIGKSISNFTEILNVVHNALEGNFSAKSAVEIALYDLFAQNLKVPLYRLLGGNRKKFKTGITISLNDTRTMIQDALEAQNRGFNSLKIKLGDDYKEDIQRVKMIHKALHVETSLKLDANQGWSKEECVEFLNSIEAENIPIEMIEQPVKKDDLEGLKYIKQRTSIPLLADESVFSPKDAIKILEAKAVDFVNIKLDKCGGISKALLIADICKLYGVKCMMGCMLEGAISVGAALHVASARSETITMLDLDAPILCETSPVIGGVKFIESHMELGDDFGLGIQGIK